MRPLGPPMPFETGGAPRVRIVDPGGMTDMKVVVDDETVHTFEHAVALKDGWTGTLADGSTLEVALRRRYGSLFARVDVRRNGRALPGSAWDPARFVTEGAILMLALAAWPIVDLVSRRPLHPVEIAISATFFVLAGLARRRRRVIATTALGIGALLLLARAALLLSVEKGFFAPLLCVLLATTLIRDARAARDLPRRP